MHARGSHPARGVYAQVLPLHQRHRGSLSAPVVAGGRVFVSAIDRHTVYALNAQNGEIDWHRTVIVEGKKDINAEREGFLEYLAPNHEDVLFTVNFERMGIHSLDVEKGQANESSIKRVKVTMFVESMTLDYGSGLT